MKTRILIYGLLFLMSFAGFSQNNGLTSGFWNFTSLDGEVRLRGHYRNKYSAIYNFSDTQESSYFSGGLQLNTN
ncbi:hypothetical protein ACFLTU_10060, partial [Bacteroidota bacterium]